MPRVTVALFQGPGLVSRLIRWQTRSAYSHAAIVLPSGAVIESREGIGVRQLSALEPKHGEEIDFFAVDVTDEQLAALTRFLHRQLGKKYDWTMVARFVTRRQESRASRGRWFCSELVFAAFQVAGIHLLRGTEPWEVSPGLLARSPLLIAEDDVIPFPSIA